MPMPSRNLPEEPLESLQHKRDARGASSPECWKRKELAAETFYIRSCQRAGLLVEAGLTLLLFEGVLDPTRVGEGHAVELVDASCVGLYRQGDVDEAFGVDRGYVAQADALYDLGLPAAL